MKTKSYPLIFCFSLLFFLVWQSENAVHASNLDAIGVTVLRAVTTNLNGAGIYVAQPEADDPNTPPGTNTWQVDSTAVGQPANLFTYIYSTSSGDYPNSLGFESHHAENVADNFYGIPSGVATNIAHVDNYEADYFVNLITSSSPASINDTVVNQSFIFGNADTSLQQMVDAYYDNYAAQFGALFVSGAGNGVGSGNNGQVNPPATCYNGIGVGVSDNGTNTSIGPTIDNGRCKPDIIAPGGATSFSTPLVSGAAALLMQAGLRGDGGGDTNSAADIRTIKALLLNGAVKPAGWTNAAPSPLDFRYGAGVLNIFNSYKQLAGGKHGYIFSEEIPNGELHPPANDAVSIGTLNGWDFSIITSSSDDYGVNHYYFNVTNDAGNSMFTATITLVWNRPSSQLPNLSTINNLDLFLYDCASSNLVAASTSVVDNVEHIFIPRLPQGRYDLQVLKNAVNAVSDNETYALAWEFFSENLAAQKSGMNLILSWPVYPDGFVLESATNLISPNWTNNLPAPIITNNQNVILLNATTAAQFFRLREPDF
ncbi:MAG TPA: S8 family serine peptidase [Verrucomicrobiae bacterium]|nr:S8 family serine peptidase [Verrucomicrobiae bacterium]